MKKYILLFCSFLIIFGCNKENSLESDSGNNPAGSTRPSNVTSFDYSYDTKTQVLGCIYNSYMSAYMVNKVDIPYVTFKWTSSDNNIYGILIVRGGDDFKPVDGKKYNTDNDTFWSIDKANGSHYLGENTNSIKQLYIYTYTKNLKYSTGIKRPCYIPGKEYYNGWQDYCG